MRVFGMRGVRHTPYRRSRAGQGLLDQRGCLDETPLAGQAGGLGHRRHLACIHDGSLLGVVFTGLFAGMRRGPGAAVVIAAAQTMRAVKTALTSAGARKAPSTSTEAIVARASWG